MSCSFSVVVFNLIQYWRFSPNNNQVHIDVKSTILVSLGFNSDGISLDLSTEAAGLFQGPQYKLSQTLWQYLNSK